jgi:hypothetical protein
MELRSGQWRRYEGDLVVLHDPCTRTWTPAWEVEVLKPAKGSHRKKGDIVIAREDRLS